MSKTISRRSFLKGAALSAAAFGAMGVGLTSVSAEESANGADKYTWDREVDMLVVGYGLAGAVACVQAYDIDPNARILMLEKMPDGLGGGNSRASGQTIVVPQYEDRETFKKYLKACNEPNPIPEEYMDWWVDRFATQTNWLKEKAAEVDYEYGYVGGGELKWGSLVTEFAGFPGSDFVGCSGHLRSKTAGSFEYGGCWNAFEKLVQKRNIEVLYSTPVTDLVQDGETKEVYGVVAKDANGKEIRIRAVKGVLLACGGFENNLEMQRNYHGEDTVFTGGTPGNTGDGITWLMKAGAQMWHMRNQTQSGGFWLGIKVPEYEATFFRNFTFKGGNWIEVDSDSQRFYNESGSYHRQHMKYIQYGRYADLPHHRANPVHLIFDDTTRQAQSVASQWLSWPVTSEGASWSSDNAAEIEKGWIVKADTIEELAEKIGRDPETLKATIDRYNAMAEAGVDEDYARTAETMAPIATAPFYAVELTASLVATTGGAKRNTKGEVLDWDDQPIKGLYEAGELGSYVSNLYQNGVFLAECVASGRSAACTMFGTDVESIDATVVVADESGELDISSIPDGVYTGTGTNLHGEIEVQVTVQSGKIAALEVTEGTQKNLFSTIEEVNGFLQSIVEAQSLDVDVISGATTESQAIVGAITNALK